MKAKTLLFICLCAFGLSMGPLQVSANFSSVPILEDNLPIEAEEIKLQGELIMSVGPNSIEAGASDDAVYIQFNQSFGNVNITIYNSCGLAIYNTVINTSVQPVVIIPFFNAASDTYTVELSTATGHAEGDFNKL